MRISAKHPKVPSWVDHSQFEQAIEEVFEAGRSEASASIIMGGRRKL